MLKGATEYNNKQGFKPLVPTNFLDFKLPRALGRPGVRWLAGLRGLRVHADAVADHEARVESNAKLPNNGVFGRRGALA